MPIQRIPYSNGDVYEGESDCTKNGQGTMRYKNGDIYEGQWKDDLRNGQGTETVIDDDYVYEGEWKDGKREGQGKFTFSDAVYEGQWLYDHLGQGTIRYNNGDVYEGQLEYYGSMYGQGKMRYKNGNIYQGQWLYSKPNGEGTMTYANGNIKRGFWDKGRRLRNPDDYDFYQEDEVPPVIPPEISNFDKFGGSKTNKRKTNKCKRKTNKCKRKTTKRKRKTTKRKRKTTKRKTNKKKTNKRKTNKRK